MTDLRDQPPEWRVVFEEIKTLDDALALIGLWEWHDDALFANDLPLDAFVRDWALLSERSVADWLGALVGVDYTMLYSPLRPSDPTDEAKDALRARCRAGGVELTHRPDPGPPWQVVARLVANEADVAAFHALAAGYMANNWWFALDEAPMPQPPATPATAEQLADFIARCRAAGVLLIPHGP